MLHAVRLKYVMEESFYTGLPHMFQIFVFQQRAPLHEAAENGHTSIVECLLGKVPAGNNIKDVRGVSMI